MPLDPGTNTRRPPPPPRQPQSVRGAVAGAVGPDPYDYSTDPILQQIRALVAQSRADAQAQATRRRQQLAIEYGEGAAGEANPHSVKAKLRKARAEEPKKLTEALNADRLFYSSTFGQKHGELSNELLENETNAANAYRDQLSGVSDDLRSALLGADTLEREGEGSAADRMIERRGDTPAPPQIDRTQLLAGAIGAPPRPALAKALGGFKRKPLYGRIPE